MKQKQEYQDYKVDGSYAQTFFLNNRLETNTTIDGFKYMCNGAKCEIDWKLKQRLDMDLVAISNDWDLIYCVSGMEGSGKSKGVGFTMASYFAFKLKRPFSNSSIGYTTKQFEKWVDNAKPGDVFLWDEFVLSGSVDDILSDIQKALKKKFTLIRDKNLIIILVIPHFHMLSKYWAVSRTRALVECTSPDGIQRGTAKFYGYRKKRFAYINGKKNMSMDVFKCDFEIKFLDLGNIEITENPIIDFDEYKLKKHSSLEEDRNDRIEYLEGKRIKKYRFALTKLFKYLILKENFTYTDLEKLVDSTVEKSTISDWIYLYDNRKGAENGK